MIHRSCGSARNQRTTGGSRRDDRRAAGVSHILSAEEGEGRTVQRVERTRLEEFESYLTVERGKRKKKRARERLRECEETGGLGRKSLDKRVQETLLSKYSPRLPEIAPTTLDNSISCQRLLLRILFSFFFAPKSCGAHKS